MSPVCPTCKTSYNYFFGPGHCLTPPADIIGYYFYPNCLCYNWIAVYASHKTSYEFQVPDKFHLIYLESIFKQYFDVIKPMRSFANGHVQQNVRQAFAVLKEKCTINKEFPNVSDYTLYSLLWALENHYQFNQFDIDWMIEKRLYPITANYYFKEYNRDHNFWNLIKSCSAWRKAGFPDIGLQVTENVISARSVEMAAILTTRGGAFKDLGVLDTAEQCARSALTYSISKYPYSLLGAIYYLNGSPEKGDEYFEKAMQLGLSSNARDRMILEAYTDASIPQKEEMMKYFQNHNQALFLSLLGF